MIRRSPHYPFRHEGFTLIELIITIAVTAIITYTTVSNWRSVIDSTASRGVQSLLTQSFADARSHAVKANVTTTLCPLDSNLICSSNWGGPITVFSDPDNDRALTSKTELIQIHPATPAGTITASNSGPNERRYFQYNPDGSAKGTIGNIIWCPESGDATKAIQLRMNFGGRITWATDSDGDGIREDSHKQRLTCGS